MLEDDLSSGDFRDACGVEKIVCFVELGGVCFGIFDDGAGVDVAAGDGHGEEEVIEGIVCQLVLARGVGGLRCLIEEGVGDFGSGDGFGVCSWGWDVGGDEISGGGFGCEGSGAILPGQEGLDEHGSQEGDQCQVYIKQCFTSEHFLRPHGINKGSHKVYRDGTGGT